MTGMQSDGVDAAGSSAPAFAAADRLAAELSGLCLGAAAGAQPDDAGSSGQGPSALAAAAAPAGASARVAGLDIALQALRELVGWPRLYAQEGRDLGVNWPRGLLLHGPPGCGKTLLVAAVAGERARGQRCIPHI